MNIREKTRIDRIKHIYDIVLQIRRGGKEINLRILKYEIMAKFGVTARLAKEYLEVACNIKNDI